MKKITSEGLPTEVKELTASYLGDRTTSQYASTNRATRSLLEKSAKSISQYYWCRPVLCIRKHKKLSCLVSGKEIYVPGATQTCSSAEDRDDLGIFFHAFLKSLYDTFSTVFTQLVNMPPPHIPSNSPHHDDGAENVSVLFKSSKIIVKYTWIHTHARYMDGVRVEFPEEEYVLYYKKNLKEFGAPAKVTSSRQLTSREAMLLSKLLTQSMPIEGTIEVPYFKRRWAYTKLEKTYEAFLYFRMLLSKDEENLMPWSNRSLKKESRRDMS